MPPRWEPSTMQTVHPEPSESRPVRRLQRLTILELMALIAGVAFSLWLISDEDLSASARNVEPAGWLVAVVYLLGGVSAVGVPLLLLELRQHRALWGAGKVLWFSQGTAAWLMWPPVIYARVHGKGLTD